MGDSLLGLPFLHFITASGHRSVKQSKTASKTYSTRKATTRIIHEFLNIKVRESFQNEVLIIERCNRMEQLMREVLLSVLYWGI